MVAMADGYAQAGRRAVLVNLHSAGGVGHGLGQVFNAYRQRTPMIVLAGQQARSLLPDRAVPGRRPTRPCSRGPYVKWSCEPARAADVPAAIARAHHVATQPPCGPDLRVGAGRRLGRRRPTPVHAPPAARPASPPTRPRSASWRRRSTPASARRSWSGRASTLTARSPTWRPWPRRPGPAVWAAPDVVAVLVPRGPPAVPRVPPPGASAPSPARCAGHDLVLVLGAPVFTYHVYCGPGRRVPLPPLYLISDDEQVLARAEAGTGIRSTVRGWRVRALTRPRRHRRRGRRRRRGRARRRAPAAATPIPAATCSPRWPICSPDTALLVEEVPSHLNVRRDHLPVRAVDTRLLTTASGALGYGLPAAVGAALAAPRPAGGRRGRRRVEHVRHPGAVDGGPRAGAADGRDPRQRPVRGGTRPRRRRGRGRGARRRARAASTSWPWPRAWAAPRHRSSGRELSRR